MKYVYVAVDNEKTEVIGVFMACNDSVAIRDNLGLLSRVIPLKDIKIYRVATIDSLFERKEHFDIPDNPISLVIPMLVSLDSYKFPESNENKVISVENPIDK
ncbi:hypothetical protein [Sigmofec virus UA08Rod_4343]|uniref:Uncharacterized protein n=1 Tax=Sigmofec virus UA08Rod_4343 TaxID=2929400 RepID=A0A976N1L1_9VIRU|nr:hypothetical protein [Sigmofec virus UA08Rod_4343]